MHPRHTRQNLVARCALCCDDQAEAPEFGQSGLVDADRAAMARIRDAAVERGIHWDDRWFFEVPQESAA